MNERTTTTYTPAGYTITTGRGITLAENATRDHALDALFHRGFTPEQAVASVNTAVRLGSVTVADLPAA